MQLYGTKTVITTSWNINDTLNDDEPHVDEAATTVWYQDGYHFNINHYHILLADYVVAMSDAVFTASGALSSFSTLTDVMRICGNLEIVPYVNMNLTCESAVPGRYLYIYCPSEELNSVVDMYEMYAYGQLADHTNCK